MIYERMRQIELSFQLVKFVGFDCQLSSIPEMLTKTSELYRAFLFGELGGNADGELKLSSVLQGLIHP